MDDIDALLAQAQELAPQINKLLYRKDKDVVLAAFAYLIGAYLITLPHEERGAELEDWLRLVRKITGIGETMQ